MRVIPRKHIRAYVNGERQDNDTLFINLGIRRVIRQDHVINPLEVIESVSRPTDLRNTLGRFLPPRPERGEDYWVKGHGYGGSDTFRVTPAENGDGDELYGYDRAYPDQRVDYQKHIQGTEYRVNTIGDTVIQAHTKEGHENWEWCGLEGIRKNAIIPMVKEAVASVPYGDRSFIGWDIIHDGRQPYILEANTSPGVGLATAQRVVDYLMANHDLEPTKVF